MENITMLNTWINPTILAICLVVGYAVKHLLPRVSNRLILPFPSLKGWMHRKSWINTGIAIKGSNSMLPITLLYSSQIRFNASGVSKPVMSLQKVALTHMISLRLRV